MTSKRNQAQIIENNNVIDVVCSKIKDEDIIQLNFLILSEVDGEVFLEHDKGVWPWFGRKRKIRVKSFTVLKRT